MVPGIMLVLMGFASPQIINNNTIESMEVTPKIEIVDVPSEFSVFRQVGCNRYISVFGVHIFATPTTPEEKLSHAAGVLAQYLDNDEDGVPDNTSVLSQLVSRNVFIIMPGTDAEMEGLEIELVEGAGYRFGQDLYGEETKPDFLVDGKINALDGGYYDGALEEILHPITHYGYANAYPEVFGTRRGTTLAKCMDAARGGYFERVPQGGPKSGYPAEAWYHYTDETCDYGCMITEYIYWALTSILGTQDFPGRQEHLEVEWELNTRERVRTGDAAVYELLTDPQYRFPTKAPDGNYKPSAFPVTVVPIVDVNDED
ncbi:MAG: hypothetical protein OXU36_09350 [Candidatus Poribacteria bacterium]|nr:hypothetical protein [Candidatus Poribacteria bacterium]